MRFSSAAWVILFAACGRGGFSVVDEPDTVVTVPEQPEEPDDGSATSVECAAGFELAGETCVDIDECAGAPCAPEARCENTAGGFNCFCSAGFSGDGTICVDEDDCAGPARCDPNAECIDGLGTFECRCLAPLVGDGFSCTTCGNGSCDGSEGCVSCPEDCGVCDSACSGGNCQVVGLRLIEPNSLADRGAVADGQVFDLDRDYPNGISLVAVVEPPVVGSVQFFVGEVAYQTEEEAPYGVGENRIDENGNLVNIFAINIAQGTFQFRLRPSGDAAGLGDTGGELVRTLSVVNGGLSARVRGRSGPDNPGGGDAEESPPDAVILDAAQINLGASFTFHRFSDYLFDEREPIDSAVVRFTAAADSAADTCTIRFSLAETDGVLQDRGDAISSRARRSPEVVWDVPPFVSGESYETPNLVPLLVDAFESRPGDASSFSVTVVSRNTGASCVRNVFSREGDRSRGARFVATF